MPDSERQVATALATVTSAGVGLDEDSFKRVRDRFGDPRAKLTATDFYGFDLAASSDGRDFYFTKPDPATSFVNYVQDLKVGQAVLGSAEGRTGMTECRCLCRRPA